MLVFRFLDRLNRKFADFLCPANLDEEMYLKVYMRASNPLVQLAIMASILWFVLVLGYIAYAMISS